ncbi:MAG: hypothetical protein HW380_21 [Magnetococcales bacterium]|nr:hypothetical protein [Magnetococcales bacterium]
MILQPCQFPFEPGDDVLVDGIEGGTELMDHFFPGLGSHGIGSGRGGGVAVDVDASKGGSELSALIWGGGIGGDTGQKRDDEGGTTG